MREVENSDVTEFQSVHPDDCEHPYFDVHRDGDWRHCTICGESWKLEKAEP